MDSSVRHRSGDEGPVVYNPITLRHLGEGLLVSLLYALLLIGLLHPWFTDPAHSVASLRAGAGGVEVADVNLVMWILSWDWHALTTDPFRLFDANIFYPARNALASSEHLLGHLPIFGPVYGVSGNPVLAYQLNFLGNLTLCGTGLYALLRHWGLPAGAAFFGGFLYVFFPFRLHFVDYTHLSAGQYAPLALLFLDRTLLFARGRDAVAFCLLLLVQLLCSYYLAYFTMIALSGYLGGVVLFGRRRLTGKGFAFAAGAGAIALAVFGAFSIPYVQLRSAGSIPDETDLKFLKLFSVGPWWEFLDRPNLHYLGVAPLLFAALGVLLPRPASNRVPWARAATLGLALACYAMAFGPAREISGRSVTFPYHFVMQIIPGFSSMRAPIRFLLMAQLGFASLAAFGLAWLQLRTGARFGRAVGFSLALLVSAATVFDFGLLTKTHNSRPVAAGGEIPAVYRALAAVPRGPVLEIPQNRYFGHFRGAVIASQYMLNSTFHWQPLIDGYSGYAPPSAFVTRGLMAALPDLKALRLLVRTTGLRYVVVHRDLLPEAAHGAWREPAGLQLLGEFGPALLFEVRLQVEPDLMDDLVRPERRCTTLLGVPLAGLTEDERRVSFQTSYEKRVAIAGHPIGIDVLIINESDAVWPALLPSGDHMVTVGYRWERDGKMTDEEDAASRLAYDLGPGESVSMRVAPVPPGWGELNLVIGLVQDGEWFPTTTGRIPVTVHSPRGLAGLAKEDAAELLEMLEGKRRAAPSEDVGDPSESSPTVDSPS